LVVVASSSVSTWLVVVEYSGRLVTVLEMQVSEASSSTSCEQGQAKEAARGGKRQAAEQ
jgi:hypothetical protein